VCLCHSRLKSDERAFVDAIAPKLGVHLTEQLSSAVTHLTMSSVLHTPKLLLALAYRVPVVVPQWLKVRGRASSRSGSRAPQSSRGPVPRRSSHHHLSAPLAPRAPRRSLVRPPPSARAESRGRARAPRPSARRQCLRAHGRIAEQGRAAVQRAA
jgi:hypothetical protein